MPIKKGDIVKCIDAKYAGTQTLIEGETYTVSDVDILPPYYVKLNGVPGYWYPHRFESAANTEFYIKALEKLGYTITPPTPKRTGVVCVMLANDFSMPVHASEEDYKKYFEPYKDQYTLIARVEWTEGDGLLANQLAHDL